ncbi:MAG: hypothetical protein IJ856_00045, partial [Candidatus Methanomethylophilaceae archaeon]|nr:hypothetical protein [Candidatus Methanomethylophilaceae archaeon]
IIAVVAVVIVAVAAVALFYKPGSEEKRDPLDGRLEVYGNANNDYVVDNKDLEIVKKIINKDEGYTLANYPLADAIADGVVDQKDVDQITKIIDGTETGVWHLNHRGTDVEPAYTSVPIKSCIALSSADMLVTLKVAGVDDRIAGVSSTNYISPILFPDLYKKGLEKIGASTMKIDTAKALELKKNDPSVTAIICPDNAGYIKDNETELAKTFDIVRLIPGSGTTEDFVSCVLTVGFLFGESEQANKVVDWYSDLMDSIDKSIGDKVRVKAMTMNSEKNVCTETSPYTGVILAAGAQFPYGNLGQDKVAISRSFDKTTDTWLYTYDEEYLAHNVVMQYDFENTKDTYWARSANYDQTKPFQEHKYIMFDGSMPVPVRVAYLAEQFYPDEIKKGFGDEKHQEFIDLFFKDMKDYKVADHLFVMTS